ncbi:hypothetical protein RB195_003001 [Necator americanus]|uniref:Uncharacterized protein n=1 Tax=Necator americanus TaxID=51031 RepID=A0ABR1DMA0_NECAM
MLRHAKEQVTVRRSRVWATGMVIRPAQPGPSEVIAAPLPFRTSFPKVLETPLGKAMRDIKVIVARTTLHSS